MHLEKTRRRGAELEDAILDAAWEVLIRQGYPGFTYEAIAARAGTSRPVLYRRWPQRDDLLLATLTKFLWSQPIELPDTGALRDDAIGSLRNADSARAHVLTLVSVQLMEYFRDSGSSLSELRDKIRDPSRPTSMETIVARAVERGEVPDRARPARVVSLPFDLLQHEMLMTMRPVPDEVITGIVDDIWLPLLTRP
uniref:TetR/AcrR family transcriptional regulator n=1 Tax=Paractinoplanes polyasparticus TaxID=2856853 RepID=UPI001C857CBE|nr:TetR/AcrR family transcriptional regulator [Actinoplanes polyasparticus]